jgi:hypothetical protein
MAWTAPRTWVTGELVSASLMNTHLRDNLLETCAATVTTAGDMTYADAANSMGSRLAIGSNGSLMVSNVTAPIWRFVGFDVNYADASTSQTTTSTTYVTALGGQNMPTVTATTGTRALVLVRCWVSNNTAGDQCYLSYAVSGATTIAGIDSRAQRMESVNANDLHSVAFADHVSVLNAGSNTFRAAARVSGGTGTFARPAIAVIPLS